MTQIVPERDRWDPDCRQTSSAWDGVHDELIARLRRLGAGSGAPAVGSRFPDFSLPDANGRYRSLEQLLRDGPVVLSFNRGGWCPFCVAELEAWRDHAGEHRMRDARLVVVVAEVGDEAGELRHAAGPDVEILRDVDHGIALSSGLTFVCDGTLRRRYLECGIALPDRYGNDSGFLTIPATFALDRDGVVRHAFVDPDFRRRAAPAEVIATLYPP